MDKETIMQLLADGVISNEVAARYFPELKENEDGNIKKELINTINLAYDCGIAITKENRDKYVAWLERRCEEKPVISGDALREGISHFGITQYQIDNWLKKYVDVEKQGEQKNLRTCKPIIEEYNKEG